MIVLCRQRRKNETNSKHGRLASHRVVASNLSETCSARQPSIHYEEVYLAYALHLRHPLLSPTRLGTHDPRKGVKTHTECSRADNQIHTLHFTQCIARTTYAKRNPHPCLRTCWGWLILNINKPVSLPKTRATCIFFSLFSEPSSFIRIFTGIKLIKEGFDECTLVSLSVRFWK